MTQQQQTEYVTEDWASQVIDRAFAAMEPGIIEGLQKAGQTELADQFRDVVIPHMTTNIRGNLAAQLVPYVNIAIQEVLNETATMKGERMTVTKHDDKGRIIESVKVPIWATVQV